MQEQRESSESWWWQEPVQTDVSGQPSPEPKFITSRRQGITAHMGILLTHSPILPESPGWRGPGQGLETLHCSPVTAAVAEHSPLRVSANVPLLMGSSEELHCFCPLITVNFSLTYFLSFLDCL